MSATRTARGPTAVVLACCVAAGCAGPRYSYEELPDRPIAIVFRTLAESDQYFDAVLRQEEILEVRRTGRARPKGPLRKNFLDAESMASLFGLGTSEERMASSLGRIAFVNPRTAEVTPVEWAPRGARPLAFSPDGSKFLYVTLRRKVSHVYERDVASGDIRQVTYDEHNYVDAAFCGPDAIVLSGRGSSGRVDLLLRKDGAGAAVPITKLTAAFAPSCVPDGSLVIFEAFASNGRSMLMSLDLTTPDAEPVALTEGSHPSVTPDGAWVVFTRRGRSGTKLWRMRVDGSGRHPLGKSGNWEHTPTVSPDGRFVLFAATRTKRPVRHELWIRPLDGDDDRPMRVRGDALHPAW